MHVIRVRNVHAALYEGIQYLKNVGQPMPSRAGDVIVAPGPVTTVYERPTERVLFYPERDANPFFHFFESLWILAGRNDVAYLAQFVKRMAEFSDDGETFHGAYGNRLREHFSLDGHNEKGSDQIALAIQMLRQDPRNRRVVLQIWDAEIDLGRNGKDLPCNTQIYLGTSFGRANRPNMLNMTVCNRSNDIIWGAYGANAVQFSVLLEYLAAQTGLDVGRYYQVSNNYHAYVNTFFPLRNISRQACAYTTEGIASYPLVSHPASFDEELNSFITYRDKITWLNDIFPNVARPMLLSHEYYKKGQYDKAVAHAISIAAPDWRKACVEWLDRRIERKSK